MATTKKKATAAKLAFNVSPIESSFEVAVPGINAFGWDETFRFSVGADGTVTINEAKVNQQILNSQANQNKAELDAVTKMLLKRMLGSASAV